ncbi:MAG: glycosyltransferase [Paludibacteraceae bacterium]|nr:glycosyltransferase [Paludibacteraceae bacterium]
MSLSVIIPCYNVEPYLVQCLDSVLVDNAFLGEVICVDDGSTDSTAAILHRYAGRYVNLQVITQPNAGLSAARNKGLKYATGDYIYFLDSDDYLYPHILQSMLTLAQTNNLDVVAMSSLKDGVEPYFSADLYIDGVVSGIEFARQFYEHCGYSYPAPVWMYIYRRKFLLDNQLAFLEGFLHEDEDFTPRVLTFCQRLMLTNQPVQYHRVKREGAITSTTSVKHLNDLSIIQRQLYCSILQKYSELWGGYWQMRYLSNTFTYYFVQPTIESNYENV